MEAEILNYNNSDMLHERENYVSENNLIIMTEGIEFYKLRKC